MNEEHRAKAHKNYNSKYGNIRISKDIAEVVSEKARMAGITMKDFTESLLEYSLIKPEYCRDALEWRFGKRIVNELMKYPGKID